MLFPVPGSVLICLLFSLLLYVVPGCAKARNAHIESRKADASLVFRADIICVGVDAIDKNAMADHRLHEFVELRSGDTRLRNRSFGIINSRRGWSSVGVFSNWKTKTQLLDSLPELNVPFPAQPIGGRLTEVAVVPRPHNLSRICLGVSAVRNKFWLPYVVAKDPYVRTLIL